VDIDWEFPNGAADSTNYGLLIKELRAKLGGKLLTCAVAGNDEKGKWIPRSALLLFDMINIMAFDFTGSFPGSLKGQHSSLANAKNGLLYWRSRGATKDKCVIGIPLYGKDFNAGGADIAYNDIVARNPGLSPNVDEINNIFFNGPSLVKAKATYVAEYSFGGCFFWQLAQDRSGNLVSQAKEGLKAPPLSTLPTLAFAPGRSASSRVLALTGPASLPAGLRDVLGRVPSPSRGSAAGNFFLPAAAAPAAAARGAGDPAPGR
jgi:GH18 family chitinase